MVKLTARPKSPLTIVGIILITFWRCCLSKKLALHWHFEPMGFSYVIYFNGFLQDCISSVESESKMSKGNV
jgi:hypothetical protein